VVPMVRMALIAQVSNFARCVDVGGATHTFGFIVAEAQPSPISAGTAYLAKITRSSPDFGLDRLREPGYFR